jgi:nitroimidazol reductase NimA-like FMN-containing flavoprotein (pyridoxamine 5'-phosphate oxidase superfamily)
LRDLTPEEIDAFLREEVVGRIGCTGRGDLYVVPIIYAYEDGAAYVLTTEGRKTRMMRANPEVCFEVDRYDADTGSWRSVIAYGRYEELEGADAEAARTLLAHRFEERTGRRRERPSGGGEMPFVAFRVAFAEKSGREVRR